ncbi:MAG: GNAT family N-acetyltransferase [Chloroflexi bacterium]|nr:GNAT family N-acetyltransferase [Chloroflexota bacterium]
MLLETARLILRSLRADDAPALATLWTDPDVTRFMGGPREYAKLIAIFDQDARVDPPPQFDLFPVIEKASGAIIGHCGLLDKEIAGATEIELVYVFAKSAWGKGYATEIAIALRDYAFDVIELDRIVALIEPENRASQRVAEKIGMTREKDVVRPGGTVRRLYVMHADRTNE